MLAPKRIRHRKVQRGSMKGNAKGGTKLNHGVWGIQALERAWITNRQIEATRVAITRKMKRGGNVWITIMSNVNIIAVASLADVACILLAEGVTLEENVRQTAEQKGINVYSSPKTAYELAARLADLLK